MANSPILALLALLAALVLSATALPQAAAPTANSTTTTSGSAGTVATILMGTTATLPEACKGLVTNNLTPLLTDATCQFSAMITGQASSSADLNTQLSNVCSKTCTDKAQAAMQAISNNAECASNQFFWSLVVAAFYEINEYCLKSTTGSYCAVDQAKELEAAKLNGTAPAAQWPKATLCTDCTQKQAKLGANLTSSSELFSALSTRTNPASNVTYLKSTCGDAWVTGMQNASPVLVVVPTAANASASTAGAGGAGGAGAGTKPNSASALSAAPAVIAGLAAVVAMSL